MEPFEVNRESFPFGNDLFRFEFEYSKSEIMQKLI